MPYLSLNSGIPGVTIGAWKIEEDELFFLERIKLYENEWIKLGTITHPQKRLEWLSSRLCIKQMLKIVNTTRVESLSHQTGQPYLSNHSHFISYTHSNEYAAAIASSDFQVGIDIEYRKRKRNLKTRFLWMNEKELAYFEKNPRIEVFLLAWSAKETLYKIYGQGVAFKDNIDIELENFCQEHNGILPATVQRDGSIQRYEVRYIIYPDFLLTYTHHKLQ